MSKIVMEDNSISRSAKCLYAYLCCFSNSDGVSYPTRKKICCDLSLTTSTFSKNLRELTEKGYIKVKQEKNSGKFSHNIYTICDNLSE